MFTPLISICIPAYKQPALLQRCLDSISMQTYKNIEIIISDDSDNDSVAEVVRRNGDKLTISYYHNTRPLGSPANWNNALEKATGELYLLLHHDDFFSSETALQQYCYHFEKHTEMDGFFCKSTPVSFDNKLAPIKYEPDLLKKLLHEPDHLIRSNQIGPPSNLMLRSSVQELYDTGLIWLVDVEYYIRLIKNGHKLGYIDATLVHIGIHQEQITQFCTDNPQIVLKENLILAQQVDKKVWRDIKFYDYYWRLLRNNHIEKEEDLGKRGVMGVQLIAVLKKMLCDLSKMPAQFRFIGFFSKAYMFKSWLRDKA